jgi:hypothetical protein
MKRRGRSVGVQNYGCRLQILEPISWTCHDNEWSNAGQVQQGSSPTLKTAMNRSVERAAQKLIAGQESTARALKRDHILNGLTCDSQDLTLHAVLSDGDNTVR